MKHSVCYLLIQISTMRSSRFVTTGKAFPQKCGLLPYPYGLMSSWAFVLWAFVRIPTQTHSDYINAHIANGKTFRAISETRQQLPYGRL